MSNETNPNYSYITRSYNNFMERSDLSIGEDTTSSGASSSTGSTTDGNASTNNSGSTEVLDGTIDNGSVETQPVKSDGGMADLWIGNLIRSTNWKPRTVGFYIDGQTGYAEFTNVYVSGNIQALTGLIGGFSIGATDLSATSGGNTTILSSGPVAFSSGPTGLPTVTITQAGILTATNAVISGTITATVGFIGGFALGTDYIRDVADSFGMASTVTGGNDIRMWAGSTFANRATAPFRVYEDGSIGGTALTITKLDLPDTTTVNSVHIDTAGNMWWGANVATGYVGAPAYILKTGAAHFTSGNIGGWIIGSTSLTDTAGTTGISSAITGGDDIRFWAGHVTPASAPFIVTEAGVITASSGTIGGCILATTSIGSTTFVSGPLGSGWNISNSGTAEFQNISVRGVIRTSVFEKDTISAVNGMVLISKADVLTTDMTALDASTLTIRGDTSFVNNEVIRIKDGIDDEWMLVTNAAGAPTYVVTRDLAGSYPANTNPIWKKGTSVVSMGVGTGTKTGYISLDSSSANSPFVDIYGRNSNTYTNVTLHARLGWLIGITDADVGLASTDVWGLYTDNAYIKGTVVANLGYIGGTTGWTIATGYIKKDTGVELTSAGMAPLDYPFYAGAQYTNRATAPFRVSNAGVLNATGATITGNITASTGNIGGWVITASDIKDVAGVTGMSSTVTAGDDIRFWAGHATPASAPFYVTESGTLVASSATITGVITADTGKIGGASGWTIAATKLYGGSGSAFSGMIQGTGTTKSFFAGATDNAGTAAKFYVTAAGDLVATSATISGYKLFEAIVAPTGGDYTTVAAALAAGKTRIFVRNGTYTNEPRWTILTAGTNIVGESKAGVVITFAKDTVGGTTCISIPFNKNNCNFNSLTLNSYDFTGDQILYDTSWQSIATVRWTETDPNSRITTSGGTLTLLNPHTNARALFTDKLTSTMSISSGVVSVQSYMVNLTGSANEAQGGMYLYVDANNYAAVVTNSAYPGDVKWIVVKAGVEVYSYSPGWGPSFYDYKITYNLTTHDINFYLYYTGGGYWYDPAFTTVNQNLGGPVYLVYSSADAVGKTGADVIYFSDAYLTNSLYTSQYPSYAQSVFGIVASYTTISNCLMQAKRGYVMAGGNYGTMRDSYINQNTIVYNGTDFRDVTGAFSSMNSGTIENVTIDMNTLNIGTNVPSIIQSVGNSTFSGCKMFSGINGQSWSIAGSNGATFSYCTITCQQLIVYANFFNCLFTNNFYSPATYFLYLTGGRQKLMGCNIECYASSDNVMLIDGSHAQVMNNTINNGKKIYIHNAGITIKGVQFSNNVWLSTYTVAAMDVQIGTATDTMVIGNAIRKNTGGGSTPTITDGGTSSTIANNELING